MKTRVHLALLVSVLSSVTLPLIGCGSTDRATTTVSVSPTTVSLNAGGTQQFTAAVTGTSSTAVTWSCTGAGCGTITATGMYTAPASIPSAATVTVVARLQFDPTKSDSAEVHHVPVSVAVTESAVSVDEGGTHQFSATVTGTSNTAVTWSLSGCSLSDCGTIDAGGMYRAPASVPTAGSVHVVATSQADSSKSGTGTVSLTPPGITVAITPAGAVGVQVGTTRNFTATVHNDSSNAGVTWSLGSYCTPATCGALSNATSTSVTYTAPAAVPNPATLALTANSVADPTKWTTVSITVTDARPLQGGDYVFSFNGWQRNSSLPGRQAIVGRFHVDANGNITDGLEDINADSGVSLSVPFTGTYVMGAGRSGTLSLTTTSGTVTYATEIDATGTKANFSRIDAIDARPPASGSGYLEPQNTNVISQASIAGSYALGLSAKPNENSNLAAVGRVTIDSAGAFSGGLMDFDEPAGNHNNLTLTGSMAAPSAGAGRGTAALTVNPQPGTFSGNMNVVYYVVSQDKLLLLQTDNRGATVTDLSGEAQRQTGTYSTSSFDVPVVFRADGLGYYGYHQSATIGRISPGGDGTLTGIRDQNLGSAVTLNELFTGAYAVDASGRSTLTLGSVNAVAYLFGQNQGYLLLDTGEGGMAGSFKPQVSGPFSSSSMASTYRHGVPDAVSMFAECDVGTTTFDGIGAFTGWQWYSFFTYDTGLYYYTSSSQSLSGTYTIDANGRGMMTIGSWPLVFWMVSPDEIVAVNTASILDSLPGLMLYLK